MKKSSWVLLHVCLGVAFLACSKGGDEQPVLTWGKHTAISPEYDLPSGLVQSSLFSSEGEHRGSSDLMEASGIVYSLNNPGFLWAHEDKNNDNALFLIDILTGETVATYRIDGITNRDWEDIEIGPGPDPTKHYIYIGEIGDNDRVYPRYAIYRIEEPVFEPSHRGQTITLNTSISSFEYRYPERRKHDCETLLLDPWTKDLFVITKRSFFSIIYVLPYPQNENEISEAILVGELPFTRATGGNISHDGKELLIKTYDHIMHWKRSEGENMLDLFSKTPTLAPYNPVEPQGEAICFDPEKSYYTLSEFSNSIVPNLYFYKRNTP